MPTKHQYSIQVVAIGNEVLNGFIVNHNAAFIGQSLQKLGYHITSQQGLMDEAKSLKAGLEYALSQNDIIITTGGLGPTCDDITREILAEIWQCDLSLNEIIYQELKQRYQGIPISAENQATLPSKAIPIPNPLGTAPGLCFHEGNKVMFVLQGVPKEMEHLLQTWVIPYLKQYFPLAQKMNRSVYSFYQLSESKINPVLKDIRQQHPDIEFGIYPDQGLIKLHILSPQTIDPDNFKTICSKIKEPLKNHLYSEEDEDISVVIEKLCQEKNKTLCVVEGHTLGAICQRLSQSQQTPYFQGGLILPQEFQSIDEAIHSLSSSILNAYQADFVLASPYIHGESKDLILLLKTKDQPFKSFRVPKRQNREIEIRRCVHYLLAEVYKIITNA